MTIILAAVINAVLSLCVLATIVGMHLRAIRMADSAPGGVTTAIGFRPELRHAVEFDEEGYPASNILIG